jgi:uncharacterized cupredoxin-like copper-binding protein
MNVAPTSIKAGPVTFDVKNLSKTMEHEMIVVALTNVDQKLQTVIESKINVLGEAPDLDPGQRKTLTLNLKPGHYRIICNNPATKSFASPTPAASVRARANAVFDSSEAKPWDYIIAYP